MAQEFDKRPKLPVAEAGEPAGSIEAGYGPLDRLTEALRAATGQQGTVVIDDFGSLDPALQHLVNQALESSPPIGLSEKK